MDEPIAVVMDPREQEWMPKNSDGQFHGPITFRQALAHSRNIIAVKLLMDVGMEPVIEMARNMGIHSSLRRNLSISLGASEVTPLELTSAYTVFPNMGVRVTSCPGQESRGPFRQRPRGQHRGTVECRRADDGRGFHEFSRH